jgi:hypothetical protein
MYIKSQKKMRRREEMDTVDGDNRARKVEEDH